MENHVSRVNKYAAGVAVLFQNSILLAKRVESWNGKPVPYGGYWSIFGGTIEEGENPMMCAVRELEEESEIKISITDLKFIKKIIDHDVEFVFYVAEVSSLINPVLNEEHTEFGWFSIDALSSFQEDIDPKIIECILLHRRS
jgi:8-oxo-dGTP pyrophosphatase MutT (NUDIX family)|tara:strand:+ start:1080 stop:1505 length:426 start_codon:yes stop_codon:yes gene_type:complete